MPTNWLLVFVGTVFVLGFLGLSKFRLFPSCFQHETTVDKAKAVTSLIFSFLNVCEPQDEVPGPVLRLSTLSEHVHDKRLQYSDGTLTGSRALTTSSGKVGQTGSDHTMDGCCVLPMVIMISIMPGLVGSELRVSREGQQTDGLRGSRPRAKRDWIWRQVFVEEEDPTLKVIGQVIPKGITSHMVVIRSLLY